MMEFCKFWGKMMFDKKLGIFNKNHPVLLLAGVDNWGQYNHLKKNADGKSVLSMKCQEAQKEKKRSLGGKDMELFCSQCSNQQ